jgi:hypothetical protein
MRVVAIMKKITGPAASLYDDMQVKDHVEDKQKTHYLY